MQFSSSLVQFVTDLGSYLCIGIIQLAIYWSWLVEMSGIHVGLYRYRLGLWLGLVKGLWSGLGLGLQNCTVTISAFAVTLMQTSRYRYSSLIVWPECAQNTVVHRMHAVA